MADYSNMLEMVNNVINAVDDDSRNDAVNVLRSAIKTNEENATGLEGSIEKLEKENADLARTNSRLFLQIPSSREEDKANSEVVNNNHKKMTYEDLYKKMKE